MSAGSSTVHAMMAYIKDVLWFVNDSLYAKHGRDPEACILCFGDPQDMPLLELPQAITRWAQPQNKDWFAYKLSEPSAVAVAVAALKERIGIDFDPADVSITTGAFGGLATTLRAVLDPGDELIYLSPPWFFYVPMALSLGARPVRVALEPPGFSLPVEAIERAITPKTRAILVNTPHNPSGRIYQPEELKRLAAVLERAPQPVYLISDESYCRVLYDGRTHHSPLHYYDRSFLIYTYGKTLLAPGQRLGYFAMPPSMPERKELRRVLMTAQVTTWAFPNAVMQYAMGDLEKATIDVAALQRRRDRMVKALRDMGYEAVMPEGTFYILVRSPIADDLAFVDRLAHENVFVLPGRVFELPRWFRISLTANDSMIERSLAGFETALADARVGNLK